MASNKSRARTPVGFTAIVDGRQYRHHQSPGKPDHASFCPFESMGLAGFNA